MLPSLFNAASSKSPRSPRDPSPRDLFSWSKKNTDTKLFMAVIHDRCHQTLTFAMVHSEITMKMLKQSIKTAYTNSDVIDLVPNRYATLDSNDANYGQNHLEELVCFTQKTCENKA